MNSHLFNETEMKEKERRYPDYISVASFGYILLPFYPISHQRLVSWYIMFWYIRFQWHHFSLRYLELCCLFARSQFSVNNAIIPKHRTFITGMILSGMNHRNIAQMFRFFVPRNTLERFWEIMNANIMMKPPPECGDSLVWLFNFAFHEDVKHSTPPNFIAAHKYLLIRFAHPHHTS